MPKLSKREQFAAAALAAIIAKAPYEKDLEPGEGDQQMRQMANGAYAYADAMLMAGNDERQYHHIDVVVARAEIEALEKRLAIAAEMNNRVNGWLTAIMRSLEAESYPEALARIDDMKALLREVKNRAAS